MHKLIFTIIFALFFSQSVFAKDIPITIRPINKISTSNIYLKLGDRVEFELLGDFYRNGKIYIPKTNKITGTIVEIEQNDFGYKEAQITINQFRTVDVAGNFVKLEGSIFKSGKSYSGMQFFGDTIFHFFRGGEVQIKPKKDTFILFLKD